MTILGGSPSRLLFSQLNNQTVGSPTPITLLPFILDLAVMENTDSAATATRLWISADGGVTWNLLGRQNAVASGASFQFTFGGIVVPNLAASPNSFTASGMNTRVFGWPINYIFPATS